MMFMIAILASFLCSVTAFVPTRSAQSSRMAVSMAAERSKSLPFLLKPAKLDGSLAGDEGFDPLGLSNIDDLGIDLYWLAEAELKHARVAMLAVVGLLAQEAGFVAPGFPTGKSQVDLFWTIFDEHPAPIVSAFLFLGVAELVSGIAVTEGKKSGDRPPGYFGFNPLKFGKSDASKKDLALKEIRNGRLAMLAASGILLQGATTHTGALESIF